MPLHKAQRIKTEGFPDSHSLFLHPYFGKFSALFTFGYIRTRPQAVGYPSDSTFF